MFTYVQSPAFAPTNESGSLKPLVRFIKSLCGQRKPQAPKAPTENQHLLQDAGIEPPVKSQPFFTNHPRL